MRHVPSTLVPTGTADSRPLRIGMLSTFPPTVCGLATFASALTTQFRDAGHRVDVVCLDDGTNHAGGEGVAGRHVNGSPGEARRTAVTFQRSDVVIVQHEYGIFGGRDGDELLEILDAIEAPVIVVAHTVPAHPTPHQHEVLTEVCARADRVIVMTESAHDRLLLGYPVDAATTVTIPHGATGLRADLPPMTTIDRHAPELLTWGLLGPGKGIEHVIDALGLLRAEGIRPRYTVAGVTHPNVLAHHGDEYRHSLMQRASRMGVASSVTFDASYRTVPQLTQFVASAAAVVLPYDSTDQVTSGVLVDAIALGRPVIATAFPHAIELLHSGAGLLVPHGDIPALAAAIRQVTTDDAVRASMSRQATQLATELMWPRVAERYLALCAEITRELQPAAI